MFLHLFATEEISSASLVVENVQLLSDVSLMIFRCFSKNKGLNFLMAKFFASAGEIRDWTTGLIKRVNIFFKSDERKPIFDKNSHRNGLLYQSNLASQLVQLNTFFTNNIIANNYNFFLN